jgi:hypothetical protein
MAVIINSPPANQSKTLPQKERAKAKETIVIDSQAQLASE